MRKNWKAPDNANSAPVIIDQLTICPVCVEGKHHHGSIYTYLNMQILDSVDCECTCEGWIIRNTTTGETFEDTLTEYLIDAQREKRLLATLYPTNQYEIVIAPL